jgi:diguanylate cyclase (GGDEF)-like protein/PAS domain S-box-containing protein
MKTMADEIDLTALAGVLPDTVIVVDTEVRLHYVNPAGAHLFGWQPDEWLGRSILDLIHPDDVASVVSSTGAIQSKRIGTPVEVRVRVADGTWKLVEFVGYNALDVPGIHGLVVIARDLTRRRMWEVAGSDTVRFQQVVQHASSVTLLLDRGGKVTSVNAAFTRLLGHDVSHVVGRPLASFCSVDDVNNLEFAIEKAGIESRLVSCEASMRPANTTLPSLPMRFEIVNLLDDPVVQGLVVTAYDVSDLYHARQTLEHLARHDALTGLVNRSVLLDELERALAEHRPVAIAFIDLDRFKPVNDLLGHESGDELLRKTSERLLGLVRPGDLVARVGGDEFVVLANDMVDRAMGQALCDRIDSSLSMPYLLTEGPVRVTASVGLALSDIDATVTGLLADADLAMYEAKAARRGEPERPVTQRQRNANERRRLADDLAAGLQHGELVAFLQPIVSLELGATTGLEALVRWNHPERGLLSPAAFLDLAEDSGLDLMMGDVVLRSACAVLQQVDPAISLSLNLSVAQLADRGLCNRVSNILREFRIDPERLIVEITEHATLTRRPGGGRVSPEHTLEELRNLGASLCLDDFGTGYSSLTHIRRYPLTAIKIDRSFVAGVCDHPEDRAIIAAMVGMAGALELEVVAEGVETEEQLAAMRTIGCNKVQGYLIARPLPPSEVSGWLRAHGRDWHASERASTSD